MRHLLNTLFVVTESSYLTLDNENVVILSEGETTGRFPLHMLESILCFSYRGASPALMGACADRGINLCFLSPQGRFLARITGKIRGNVLLRKAQYLCSEKEETSLEIARGFITGKLYNSRWVLERSLRDHSLRLDTEKIKAVSLSLKFSFSELSSCNTADTLRGMEGKAAAAYFSVFNDLILRNDPAFHFFTRSRRPPLDPVNAMLSFAYSLLAADCSAALESVGLDPYVGFLHTDRPGRASLALDLMEELRSVIADRCVLTCINNRIVSSDMFFTTESGAVVFTDAGKKAFLGAWQNRKQEIITHPFLKEKMPWGLVPYVQSLLLARYLRNDLDAYPPFMWK